MTNTMNSSGKPWAGLSRLHKIVALILAAILLITWWLGRNGSLGCPTAGAAAGVAATAPVAAVAPPALADTDLQWTWAQGKLLLSGQVKDDATKKAIYDAAVKRMGSADKVDNQITVSANVAAIGFMDKLGDIAAWGSEGRSLKFNGKSVVLNGVVPVEGEKKQKGEAAALYFGSGVSIDNRIEVKAPAKPETVSLYFDTGKSAVQADAGKLLSNIIAYGNASPDSKIQLSGFHDKRGNAAANAELAKSRALAVRELLKKAGLAEDRVIMVKPQELVGDADDKQARRVDVAVAQ
jgi:outer membrane protein OmpA-like peptidoglycan-associated protein